METINIKDLTDTYRSADGRSWLASAVMNLVSDHNQYLQIFPPDTVQETITIECKINGVEVSFTKFIEYLSSSYDECVRRNALALLKEKFDSKLEAMDAFIAKLGRFRDELMYEARDKLGIHDDY